MRIRWKHFYCYCKKLLGIKTNDHWDDNPYVIL
jgi:hypothetical protein